MLLNSIILTNKIEYFVKQRVFCLRDYTMKKPFSETEDDYKLFQPDPVDWRNNCFPTMTLSNSQNYWDKYADAYKLAADLLANQKSHKDSLIFPTIFLYRHYFEIRLKYLIKVGNALFNLLEDFPKTHRLNTLWEKAKIIIIRVYPDEPQEELETLGNCILELDKIDSKSMAFRYPEDKKGDFSVPNLGLVSLPYLSNLINKVSWILDGTSEAIQQQLDCINDEYQSNY